jgi:enhancing lycopene biosynthesis protein 2
MQKSFANLSLKKQFLRDQVQMHEVNHTTGEATDTSRNVLLESARIARGKVAHLQVLIGTCQRGAFPSLMLF